MTNFDTVLDAMLNMSPLTVNSTSSSIVNYVTILVLIWSKSPAHRNTVESRIKDVLRILGDEQTKADVLGYVIQQLQIENELFDRLSVEVGNHVLPVGQLIHIPDFKNILELHNLSEEKLNKFTKIEISPQYQLYITDDNRFLVEVIRNSLLNNRGFRYFDQWEDYLLSLHDNRIIDLVDVQLTVNDNTVVIYNVPDNFQRLCAVLSNDSDHFAGNNFRNTLKLIEIVNSKAKKLKDILGTIPTHPSDFEFVTPFSDLLLYSSEDVLFSGIGASLVNAPKYVTFSGNGDSSEDQVNNREIGFGAYVRFLGLLLFELGTGLSPITIENELRNRRVERPYLSESSVIAQKGYPAHIRAFLKRTTHSIDTYRYSKYETIDEDIKYISQYIDYTQKYQTDEIIEFIDYLGLRLQAHNRNPKLIKLSSSARVNRFLDYVRDDFLTFAGGDLNRLYQFRDNVITTTTISPELFQWLHYTSLHLINVYDLWKNLTLHWNRVTPPLRHINGLHAIGFAILANVVQLEALAYMQVVGRKLKAGYIDKSIPEEFDLKLNIDDIDQFAISVTQQSLRAPFDFSQVTLDRLRIIISNLFLLEDCRQFKVIDVVEGGHTPNLEDIALFVLTISRGLILFKNGSQIWTNSKNLVNTQQKQDVDKHIRIAQDIKFFALKLEQVFPVFGGAPPDDAANFNENPILNDDIYHDFINSIDSIRIVSDSVRRKAYITRYRNNYPTTTGELKYRDHDKSGVIFTDKDIINNDPIPSIQTSLLSSEFRAKVDIFSVSDDANVLGTVVPYSKRFPLVSSTPKEKIYVAYHYSDDSIAEQLVIALQNVGFEVWCYQALLPINHWWEQITAEIRNCDVFLLLYSTDSMADQALKSEYTYAAQLKKVIHIAILDNGIINNLPHDVLSVAQSAENYDRDHSTTVDNIIRIIADGDIWIYRPTLEQNPPIPSRPTLIPLIVFASWCVSIENISLELQEKMIHSLNFYFENNTIPRNEITKFAKMLDQRRELTHIIKTDLSKFMGIKNPIKWFQYLGKPEKVAIVVAIIGAIAAIIAGLLNNINVNVTNVLPQQQTTLSSPSIESISTLSNTQEITPKASQTMALGATTMSEGTITVSTPTLP